MKPNQNSIIRQEFILKSKAIDEKNFIIRGIFSTGEEDRSGEVVDQGGWDLKEFMENPVVLFAHDHYQPAVGKVVELNKTVNGLEGAIQFAAKEYDFAMTLFNLYAGGYMRAFSVGFMNKKYEIDQENDRVILKENTLFEISAVNVPANAMALAYSKGIDVSSVKRIMRERAMIEKGVIPYHDYGNADEGAEWDGPAQMSACGDDLDKLKAICAWFDSENADVKSSYKLPHHEATDKKAVWRGVAAAMGALLGGRGGVDLPEEDKKGVYNHLAKHYADFEKEVPELKSYTDEEIKLIENGEKILLTEEKAIDLLKNSNKETIGVVIKVLTDALNSATEADKQVGTKGRTPLKEGGDKKISVKLINRAMSELLLTKKKIKNG